MTTIVTDGKSMAGDGYITSNNMVVRTDCQKIFRLADGRIIGFAGNAYNWDGIVDYFNSQKRGKKWPMVSGDSAIMILDHHGSVTVYDNDGRAFPRTAPVALGSGREFAIGALDAGADPRRAVEIACGRDTHSGGMIRQMTPGNPT